MPDETREKLLTQVLRPHFRELSDLESLRSHEERFIELAEQCGSNLYVALTNRQRRNMRRSGTRGKAVEAILDASYRWVEAVEHFVDAKAKVEFASVNVQLRRNAAHAKQIAQELESLMPTKGKPDNPLGRLLWDAPARVLLSFQIDPKPNSVAVQRNSNARTAPLARMGKILWESVLEAAGFLGQNLRMPDQRANAPNAKTVRAILLGELPIGDYVHRASNRGGFKSAKRE